MRGITGCKHMIADKNPFDRERATQRFQEVGMAYTILSNPSFRIYYDYQLRSGL